MSKFCANCGMQLEDDAKFCAGCGVATEETPVAEVAAPVVEAAPAAPIIDETAPAWQKAIAGFCRKLKSDKKLLGIVCGAAAVILVLLIVVSALLSGPAYGKAIDTYIDLMLFGEYDKIEDAAPDAFWEYCEEEYDVTLDDILEELEDYDSDSRMEYLEEEYGDNIRISYEVTDEDELSTKKLDTLADALKENYNIPRKSVTAAYKLDVELSIRGSEDEDSDEDTIYVVKIDGDWYVCSASGTLSVASLVSMF